MFSTKKKNLTRTETTAIATHFLCVQCSFMVLLSFIVATSVILELFLNNKVVTMDIICFLYLKAKVTGQPITAPFS